MTSTLLTPPPASPPAPSPRASDSVLDFSHQPRRTPVRREFVFGLIVLVSAAFAAAQQPAPPTPPPAADSQSGAMTVYNAGPGVTAPALLPIHLPNETRGRCKKDDGTAILSAIVGADGVAQDVMTFQPGDPTLDNFAVGLLTTSQFTPGTFNGSPVSVAVYVALSLEMCRSFEGFRRAGNQKGCECGPLRRSRSDSSDGFRRRSKGHSLCRPTLSHLAPQLHRRRHGERQCQYARSDFLPGSALL